MLQGRKLAADERRLVGAFAAHAAALVDRARLSEAAAEVKPLAEADQLRTALLRAVGHDLRSPLASAKASVTSLRSADVEWSESERGELLETADESLDRLIAAGRQPARPQPAAGRRTARLHRARRRSTR